MGFAEYDGYVSNPPRWYRRGIASGTISTTVGGDPVYFSATAITAFFQLCRGAFSALAWQNVDTPAELTVCTSDCATGYIYADAGKFKPGNISTADGTSAADTDGVNVFYSAPDTVLTRTSVTYNSMYYSGFPRTTTGSLTGRLTQECTMDDAFAYASCNGLVDNIDFEECRAYTTLLDTNFNTFNYQKIEGQSCVIFVTIVNATVGGNIRVNAQFVEREFTAGTLIGTQEVIIDFTAPQSSFVLRIDVPTPAPDREIAFNAAGIEKAGDGGDVTYEPETGAFRVDD